MHIHHADDLEAWVDGHRYGLTGAVWHLRTRRHLNTGRPLRPCPMLCGITQRTQFSLMRM